MSNVINWFEIPAKDYKRACAFYGKLLNGEIQHMDGDGPLKMGFLPGMQPGEVGGAIVQGESYEPTDKGSVVYLNGGNDLSDPLSRVETAGGKIIMPKTAIGENGFMAHFLDSEGNRVALHSMS